MEAHEIIERLIEIQDTRCDLRSKIIEMTHDKCMKIAEEHGCSMGKPSIFLYKVDGSGIEVVLCDITDKKGCTAIREKRERIVRAIRSALKYSLRIFVHVVDMGVSVRK